MKFLIVEQNETIANQLIDIITTYEISTSCQTVFKLDEMSRGDWDAIFVSWQIAEVQGQLNPTLNNFKSTPIIITTPVHYVEKVADLLNKHIAGYVLFPFIKAEIHTQIDRLLEKKHSKDHEQNLHYSEGYLESIFDMSLDAIIGIDEAGLITQFNKRAEEIIGISANNAIGSYISDFYGGGIEEARSVSRALKQAPGNRIFEYEASIRKGDGTKAPIRLSALSLFNRDHQPLGSIGFFCDSSDLQGNLRIANLINEIEGDELLNKMVEILATEMKAEFAFLLQYRHSDNQLVVSASYGIPISEQETLAFPLNSSIIGQAFTKIEVHRRPLVHNDVNNGENRLRSNSAYKELKGSLAVPLTYRIQNRQQVLGVLVLINKHDKGKLEQLGFSIRDQIWLETLSSQIAGLVRQEWHRLSLEKIIGVVANLLDLRSDQDVLQKIVDTLVDEFGYRSAYFRMVKPDDSLSIWAMAGTMTFVENQDFMSTPSGVGIVGKVLETKQPQLIADVTKKESGFHFEDVMHKAGWRGMAAIPMILSEQVIGVLVCYTGLPHYFSPQELYVLTSFTQLATITFNNTLLLEQFNKKQNLLTKIIQLMNQEESNEDRRITYNGILYEIMIETGAEYGSIHLVDEETQTLVPFVQRGFDATYKKTTHKVEESSIVGWSAKHRMSVLINDIKKEKQWKDTYYEGNASTRAELTAPIIYTGDHKVRGIINLESHRRNAFKPKDRQLLESLAIYPRIVSKMPLLSTKIMREREERQSINKAIRTIANAPLFGLSRNALLQTLLNEAVKVCNANLGAIHLLKNNQLVLEVAWPPTKVDLIKRKAGTLSLDQRSIIVRTVNLRKAQLVRDVEDDDDFLDIDSTTRSELCVYISDGSGILGTLNVDHLQPNAFSLADRDTLIKISDLIAVALRIVENVEQLHSMQDLSELAVASRLQSAWLHQLVGYVGQVKGRIQNIGRELKRGRTQFLGRETERAMQIIDDIENDLKRKWEPLPAARFRINELLEEKIYNYQSRTDGIKFLLNVQESKGVFVKLQSEDLSYVLELLLDNAIKALKKTKEEEPTVELRTKLNNETVDIEICDNGGGVPDNVRNDLGERIIKNSLGGGRGARIAAIIIRGQLNGSIEWNANSSRGTVVFISLPLSKNGERDANYLGETENPCL